MSESWESGNSRRRIRSLANDVPLKDVPGTPEASTWGEQRRVQTVAIDVTLKKPLVSDWKQGVSTNDPRAKVPPEPSGPLDIDVLSYRVEMILMELFSGVPYGPLLGCQTSIEWELWEVQGKVRHKVNSNWIGTTQHMDPGSLARENHQRLEALLAEGSRFQLPQSQRKNTPVFRNEKKGGKPKKPPLEWIQVPRISIRWTVAPETYSPRHGS